MITIILSVMCVLLIVAVVILAIDRRRIRDTVQFLCEQDAAILEEIASNRPAEKKDGSPEDAERKKLEEMWSAGLGNIMAYDAAQARKAVTNLGGTEE